MSIKHVSRRDFLRLSAISSGAVLLAACGANGSDPEPTAGAGGGGSAPTPTVAATEEVEVMAQDVLEYLLESDEWSGQYGSVTFRLHEGVYNGEPIYYIRTDASDQTYAEANGLVYVPLLNAGRDVAAPLYVFANGRSAILSRSPAEDDFVSLFQIKNVTVNDDSAVLDSAAAVEQAAAAGQVTIEEAEIPVFVNFPVAKWPGGELAVDNDKTETLGSGQLMAPIDTANMTVTFKLHQCYPGSRYILTDTSSVGMAPMMSVPASAPTQALMDSGATDEIWVFANGIPGSGVMGFQPAVFDNKAGQPAWSPFWNHFTLQWKDESQARVIKTSAEIRELVAAGGLAQFNGVPDTHPNGFVVNCPAPILAPNTFAG